MNQQCGIFRKLLSLWVILILFWAVSLEVNNNVYVLIPEAGMKMLINSYGFSIAKMAT